MNKYDFLREDVKFEILIKDLLREVKLEDLNWVELSKKMPFELLDKYEKYLDFNIIKKRSLKEKRFDILKKYKDKIDFSGVYLTPEILDVFKELPNEEKLKICIASLDYFVFHRVLEIKDYHKLASACGDCKCECRTLFLLTKVIYWKDENAFSEEEKRAITLDFDPKIHIPKLIEFTEKFSWFTLKNILRSKFLTKEMKSEIIKTLYENDKSAICIEMDDLTFDEVMFVLNVIKPKTFSEKMDLLYNTNIPLIRKIFL